MARGNELRDYKITAEQRKFLLKRYKEQLKKKKAKE